MTWTLFWDMHSGGGQKLDWGKIYIEAPEEEAINIFYNRFGRNPHRVTCTCCGEDYSISEEESLEQASGFHRNCKFVYRDPEGNEVDQNDAWVFGKGMREGYTSGYEEVSSGRIGLGDVRGFMTVEEYEKQDNVLVIRKEEISDDERKGDVPEEGYVWVD